MHGFSLPILLAFLFCMSASSAEAAPPIIWLTHGNERLSQDAPALTANAVELYAARGEWEPFQVIVRGPSGGLSNVNVTVSDLRSSSGRVIPESALTLYREHYVYTEGGPSWLGTTNKGEGAGWYPEPLIPFVHPETGAPLSGALDAVPASVSAGKNQPFWIDILVPRNTAPGRYSGTVTVTSDQGWASGTVALNVWNFELPLKPTYHTDGRIWSDTSKAAYIEMLKHKISPRGLSDPSWVAEFRDTYGMGSVDIGFWSGSGGYECKNTPDLTIENPPSVAAVSAAVAKYPGIDTHAYFADEAGKCLKRAGAPEKFRGYAKALQDGGTTPLITVFPTDAWIPGPYIWANSIKDLTPENLNGMYKRVRDAGQELWTYHTVYHDGVSPKRFLDYPPINYRIHTGFMSQSLDLQGFLHWKLDNWKSEAEGWDKYAAYHGDGWFVMPGSKVGIAGVVGGMRLKWYREGIEDFEYVALLKKAGQGDWALQKSREIAKSNSDWTKDMDKLLAVRKELGEKLDQLSGGARTTGSRTRD
jgi:hypothetical protein